MLQTVFIRSPTFIYLQFVQNQKQITDFMCCYSWSSCQLNKGCSLWSYHTNGSKVQTKWNHSVKYMLRIFAHSYQCLFTEVHKNYSIFFRVGHFLEKYFVRWMYCKMNGVMNTEVMSQF